MEKLPIKRRGSKNRKHDPLLCIFLLEIITLDSLENNRICEGYLWTYNRLLLFLNHSAHGFQFGPNGFQFGPSFDRSAKEFHNLSDFCCHV